MSNAFEEEKKYLEYAKQKILDEMEFCRKEMLEIPKRYPNALQGDSFLVQGLMSSIATKLKKMELSENNPYFGRIDFLENGHNNSSKIYIGKTNVKGEDGGQVITDWRTPVCSLYYDSEVGEASYEAPKGTINGNLELKRQIIIKDNELLDVLDTNSVSSDELLQPYLSVNAESKMKTIIASIQKEQNKIIRESFFKNIIVQGVAGSGKTSVALHRISYLIYLLSEQINSSEFLIIGPNMYFLDYISSILPELDTEPVHQKTYVELVNNFIGEKFTLENQEILFGSKKESDSVKKIQSYKSSLLYKNSLDSFLYDYMQNRIVSEPFKIDDTEVYSIEMIKDILFSTNDLRPNFEKVNSYFIKNFKENINNIYNKINQKYRNIYIKLPKDDPERKKAIEKSMMLDKYIKENGLKQLKKYLKNLQKSVFEIYKTFIMDLEKYDEQLSTMDILDLQKQSLLNFKKKIVSFEDLPALLHINFWVNGKNKTYKHIVIDEAQDLGLFHFWALKENFNDSTFSIYGDLAQSIYSYKSIKDWESVISKIFGGNCELIKLNKSYRTTIEITQNANKILNQLDLNQALPVIRHGNDITFNNSSNNVKYKVCKIIEWLKKEYKTIAIICKTDKEAAKVYKELLKEGINISRITSKDNEYVGGVYVITSALSKGLEFDAVMINDASEDIYDPSDETDMHLLYVACTRALHDLNILYGNKLCDVFGHNEKTVKKK